MERFADRIGALAYVEAMTAFLRWCAVPLSAFAVWVATLLVGFVLLGVLDSLCPPELMISGMCTAPWHGPAVELLLLTCIAVVAAGVVLVPALVAPRHRLRVSGVAYLCGAAFAIWVARGGSLWQPFLAAAVSGSEALAVAIARWRLPRPPVATGDEARAEAP